VRSTLCRVPQPGSHLAKQTSTAVAALLLDESGLVVTVGSCMDQGMRKRQPVILLPTTQAETLVAQTQQMLTSSCLEIGLLTTSRYEGAVLVGASL
jgi:hypothetical protein